MINEVTIIGNLVKDVYATKTKNDKGLASFVVAVNGIAEGDVSYISCIAWGTLADAIAKHCKKGSKVCVCGSLHTRSYEDKDGNKNFVTEVIATKCEFLGEPKTKKEKDENPFEGVDFPNG